MEKTTWKRKAAAAAAKGSKMARKNLMTTCYQPGSRRDQGIKDQKTMAVENPRNVVKLKEESKIVVMDVSGHEFPATAHLQESQQRQQQCSCCLFKPGGPE